MKETDSEDNLEVLNLQYDTRSSSEEINQQQTERISNYPTNFQNLPGQIYSHDEDGDGVGVEVEVEVAGKEQDSSSSDEFNLEIFHRTSYPQNFSRQASQRKNQTPSTSKSASYLKILGIEFEIAIIQERNMDAILFLKSLLGSKLLLYFFVCVTFIVGLGFRIVPLILSIGVSIATTIFDINACKTSIKNVMKVTPVFLFSASSTAVLHSGLFFYSLLVQLPFNSLLLFILLEYLIVFFNVFAAALVVTPNLSFYDDPNYQLNFFAIRIMTSFFNAISSMDALSDIVLGIELVQYPQKKFLIIGVFLLILSNIDFLQAVRKITTPTKINFKDYIFAVLVEVAVLMLTTVVLVDLSKISDTDQNENTLMATVISISTTVVNFLHNLFLLYNKSRTDSMEFF